MKHAYLIIAHNEFPVLERLLQALDDQRNDIYIHFDAKVKALPALAVQQANLYILQDQERVDVAWGDVSVVEAEYALFEAASSRGPYAYYHLLSGVDMPLKSQNQIHAFFDEHQGKEFIGYFTGKLDYELDRKVNRYHLFPRDFRADGTLGNKIKRLIRYAYMQFQYIFNIRRNTDIEFKKGTQWVSITQRFVDEVLKKKEEVFSIYAHTFCSDEIFLQTICWHSPYKDHVFDYENEGRSSLRSIGWKNGVLYDYENQDYGNLIQSGSLFARKFNSRNLEVVDKILANITQKNEG